MKSKTTSIKLKNKPHRYIVKIEGYVSMWLKKMHILFQKKGELNAK